MDLGSQSMLKSVLKALCAKAIYRNTTFAFFLLFIKLNEVVLPNLIY